MSHSPLTIHIATDHAGFLQKEEVVKWLESEGYAVIDHGAHHFDENDDFPDFIGKAAKAVSQNSTHSRGIIFGGSGQGEAIAANRFPHVRAAVYYGGSEDIIVLSRQHNDSNIISIGARFVSLEETKRAISTWLKTNFDGQEKRGRRNQKIEKLTREA